MGLAPEAQRRILKAGRPKDAEWLIEHWAEWAHEGQAPGRDLWRQWVMLAGRGFGKTRAGAEYVAAFARTHPGASIALVGATVEEARAVMVEGRSGLIAVARADELPHMRWLPSLRLLRFASGAEARLYSAANPESLRGPEHHLAWCDELAKWKRAEAAWTNLRLGLRLGDRSTGSGPRAVITTTPRPAALLKRLLADPETVTSGGPSWANPHISEDFLNAVETEHRGTRTGRQELEGVLIEDIEGALWTRGLIEQCRVESPLHRRPGGSPPRAGEGFRRVVVGVDPPAGAEGTCGIVVCGVDGDGIAYVLADLSTAAVGPEGWARRVAEAAERWGAHRVVAEANNGGKMVESVLRGAEAGLPVTLVHASEGKAARAEPVAVAFENGRARLAGRFPELEDEMAAIAYRGAYQGPGRSPDRADAMVWAMTELIVKPQRAAPRVTSL